jgi:hypothetical protein
MHPKLTVILDLISAGGRIFITHEKTSFEYIGSVSEFSSLTKVCFS